MASCAAMAPPRRPDLRRECTITGSAAWRRWARDRVCNELMRLDVETIQDTGRELPRSFHFNARRVEVVTVVDQWFGDDHRYCKVTGDDGAVYILRVVEHSSY